MRWRKRDVAAWCVAFLASCVVGVGSAHGAPHWTVGKLVAHADGKASRCKVAPRWGPKQIKCAALVVSPRFGRDLIALADCETGGTFNEFADDTPPYLGLGQFHPRTWASLPRRISRHSVFSPPWAFRGMVYLRVKDGDWHQWPWCSRHAL